jgi:hypothetical protein
MTNDTAVYDAMQFDVQAGDYVRIGKVGRPDAFDRDGFKAGGERGTAPTNGSMSGSIAAIYAMIQIKRTRTPSK